MLLADLTALADLAHEHGMPLMVDNTVPTPVLCRACDFGTDISVHSLTKYMGGHGTTIGGIVIDGGKFPWAEHADRFPIGAPLLERRRGGAFPVAARPGDLVRLSIGIEHIDDILADIDQALHAAKQV